ncbi:hypothetical protein BJV74DRAFT_843094 [Russula compacta]|nr:hypothetical protein BJV74DRAFT_843094 [Russula compacta]
MPPETVAPSLLFISSLVSLILTALQVSSLHKSQWDINDPQSIRRLLALCFMLLIVFLSALSSALGLVARQAWRTGDRSRAVRASVGGKIIAVILQSGLSIYIMFLLNLKSLVVPIPSTCIRILTFGKVRILTAVMSSPLVANTVLSIVFLALQEDYPAARLPAICWLLFFIPLFCISMLLYLSIRREKEHSIIARMWLVLAVGHACGVVSATCAIVGKGDFQTPTSLFDAFWIICVTIALHIHSILPDRYPNPSTLLSGRAPFRSGASPLVLVNAPRPSNAGSVRPRLPATATATTASAEDFRTLQDPFASPSSPLTEKPFPLFEAARVEQAQQKSLSILLAAATRHSSPADLRLPQKLLQSLEDDTPPLSPPASALVRAPRHASYSGAFGT